MPRLSADPPLRRPCGGGLGGLTMSLDGGLEEFEEFFGLGQFLLRKAGHLSFEIRDLGLQFGDPSLVPLLAGRFPHRPLLTRDASLFIGRNDGENSSKSTEDCIRP